MKKRTLTFTAALLFLLTSTGVFAQGSVSIGGELLSPVGVSAKAGLSDNSAITGAFGFFVSDGLNTATVELNYIHYSSSSMTNVQSGELSPYIGGGISVRFLENLDNQLALRVPFGMEYSIDDAPFEIYMDIGPYINLTTNVTFSMDSSLGFRYQF